MTAVTLATAYLLQERSQSIEIELTSLPTQAKRLIGEKMAPLRIQINLYILS